MSETILEGEQEKNNYIFGLTKIIKLISKFVDQFVANMEGDLSQTYDSPNQLYFCFPKANKI